MKYKEAFSRDLVDLCLSEFKPRTVLDPFAGIGTAPLAAEWRNARGTGFEIMPVGVRVGFGIAHAAQHVSEAEFNRRACELVDFVNSHKGFSKEHLFPHVKITEHAFADVTERQIAKAREYVSSVKDSRTALLLDLACMTVLESASFTRKDGQYLRWDSRSGRSLRSNFNIGKILPFETALECRLQEIQEDIKVLSSNGCRGIPDLRVGSCLELLQREPHAKFDLVVTSPPYANRYDYTRTYALELAWLGYDKVAFSALRQSLLTATVENKSKRDWLREVYGNNSRRFRHASAMHDEQAALQEVLLNLKGCAEQLSNKNVIRLIEGYFFEMAIVITELGRIVRPGGTVIMINDNVQYHGIEVPVDFILSDFAEQCGFRCDAIWKLARGKGNSSQQMAKFGRREQRKCVYKWVRSNG